MTTREKYRLLKKELKGLDVEWLEHFSGKGINMARVNGHSIVWHKYAYTKPDSPTVEVYFRGAGDVEGYVPIEGLRKRVEL